VTAVARILILTGASSTGKTTVARAAQRLTPRPTVVMAADDFDLPADARARATPRTEAESVALQAAMFRAFYEGLARWPAHGINVIAETIFLDEEQVRICRQSLVEAPFAIVRLVCDRAIRVEWEHRRGDRRPGRSDETAAADVIPDGLALELDTSRESPTAIASRLLPFL
jgi:chloramphenicol 3-O-phosphotransferase